MLSPMEFDKESLEHFFQVEHGSDWSNLPRDIAGSILERLCIQDFLQFGMVCTSWQTIVAEAIATKQSLPAPQAQLPLMINSVDQNIKVFSLTKKKLIHSKRLLFTEKQYPLGSIEGWLIMFDYSLWSRMGDNVSADPHSSPFFFLNVISNVRVNLPSTLTIAQTVNPKSYPFDKMVASSSPSSKDCFIAAILHDNQHVAFCMLADKSWTIIELDAVIFDIEILNSKLYVLVDQAGELFIRVYDLENPNTTRFEVLSVPANHGVRCGIRLEDNIYYASNSMVFFLGKNIVSGELLLIRGLYDSAFNNDARRILHQTFIVRKYIHPPFTKELQLWKYNYSDSQWIEINNLGDCSIFLGIKGFIVISSNHLIHQDLLEKNSIYFAHEKRSSGSAGSLPWEVEIGIFSLTEKSIKYFESRDMNNFLERHGMPFHWFIPSFP